MVKLDDIEIWWQVKISRQFSQILFDFGYIVKMTNVENIFEQTVFFLNRTQRVIKKVYQTVRPVCTKTTWIFPKTIEQHEWN